MIYLYVILSCQRWKSIYADYKLAYTLFVKICAFSWGVRCINVVCTENVGLLYVLYLTVYLFAYVRLRTKVVRMGNIENTHSKCAAIDKGEV